MYFAFFPVVWLIWEKKMKFRKQKVQVWHYCGSKLTWVVGMTSGDTFRFSKVFSIELVLVPRWTENLPSEGIWETLSTPHVGKWHGNKEERARQTGSEDAEICFYNFYDTHPERRRDWAVKSSRQKGSRQKRHLQGNCGVRSLLVVSQQCLARTHNLFYSAVVPVNDKTTTISKPEKLLLCGRHPLPDGDAASPRAQHSKHNRAVN